MIEESVWKNTTPIEFFVSGVLVSLTTVICAASFNPKEIEEVFNYLNQYQTLSSGVLFSTIFVAIAYMAGVFSQFIVREMFAFQFENIKVKRMREYLKHDNLGLEKNPFLKEFKGIDPNNITRGQALSCLDLLRRYILMKSPALYQDIESQLHRIRLIRILFLVEMILVVTVINQLFRDFSFFFIFALLFFAIITVKSFIMINDHFKRYCIAIERSYKVLMFDQNTDAQHIFVLQVNIW